MTDLATRVEERIRAEWPGTQVDRKGVPFVAPNIREGGTTDAFVNLVAQIVSEESKTFSANVLRLVAMETEDVNQDHVTIEHLRRRAEELYRGES